MKKKLNRKRIAYYCILLAALLFLAVYLLFFIGNPQFSFFPAVLGSLIAGAFLIVRAHGQKPLEIDLTENLCPDEDQPSNETT
ncbi:MAG: hypothetical protein E7523_10095 [Ruminococcaceae bacterium]|nr:hypothetical protein [Oscillospiraceae bacterium]